jgi:PAS domain S-box-containing protein
MVNEKWQLRSTKIGLIPVIAMAVLIVFLAFLNAGGPVYNPPYLTFILTLLFVLVIDIAVAYVSARAYLSSGSLNILLLGAAILITGISTMFAIWVLDPNVPPFLTGNQAISLNNISILIGAVLLLLSAITASARTTTVELARRKTILVTIYTLAFVAFFVVSVLAFFNQFPVFLTSSGPTGTRIAVLTATVVLVLASGLWFGLRYLQNHSSILYWYTLALVLYALDLITAVFIVHLGDILTWTTRLALYLSSTYFLLALQSRESKREIVVGRADRWANAFRSDPRQIDSLFINMRNSLLYGKLIMNSAGKPVDVVVLDVNQAFEKEIGVRKEDVVGQNVTEVFPALKADATDWIAPYVRAAMDEESFSFERFSTTPKKWYQITIYSPRKGYFVSISEDITERKKVETEVARLASFPRLNPHPVLEFDMTGNLLYANPSAESMFPDIWKAGLAHPFFSDWENIAETLRKEKRETMGRELNLQDNWFYQQFVLVPELGSIRIYSVIINNLKNVENELRHSNAELQQFAYLSSHDLQEPLRMMVSFISLLEKRYRNELDPLALEYINNALEGGSRMRQLIDDLLEYSRIETKAKPFAPVDMKEVMESTIKVLRMPIDECRADLYIEPMPTIMADGSQMEQVMQNLISNSLKFRGPERPMVHISATEGKEDYTFSVKDNGIGLNTVYADKIFQMFQRLHTKDKYAGTGVGLAIVKKIVERHGGHVWVESEEGKGATFFFTIPKTVKGD